LCHFRHPCSANWLYKTQKKTIKKSKEIKPTNIKTGKNPDPETLISYKNEDPNP